MLCPTPRPDSGRFPAARHHMSFRFGLLTLCLSLMITFLFPGCTTVTPDTPGNLAKARNASRPVVAVIHFDNSSNLQLNWDLKRGFPDVVSRLLRRSGRFSMFERRMIKTYESELIRYGRDWFKVNRPAPEGIRQAEYAVTGQIHEFRIIGDHSGLFGPPLNADAGKPPEALVRASLRISEVRNNQVFYENSFSARIPVSAAAPAPAYQQIAFDNPAFYETPIGIAAKEVMEKMALAAAGAIQQQRAASTQ